jgi:biopolymer transport protein ExbD
VQSLDRCYPWEPGGCEWTIRFLWNWMSSFGRFDVIVLAVILVYLFVVAIHISCRYYLVRRAPTIYQASWNALIASLKMEVGSLRSIAHTAPYLGLLGTCEGILGALGGVAMEKHAAMVMITTEITVALIPTTLAIPAAVLATCFHNYFCPRIDLLEHEVSGEFLQRKRQFQASSRFPLMKRFSGLPAFGSIAAPGLAIVVAGFMTFGSFHTSTGFNVELASERCVGDGDDRVIVLHITDGGELFLNNAQENTSSLVDHLSGIYSARQYRTLYVLADSGAPFQTVADALDAVTNTPAVVAPPVPGTRRERLEIRVLLITPRAFSQNCPKPIATGSRNYCP